eukprot:44463-Eustigmatos_ZCMA.PRE.1
MGDRQKLDPKAWRGILVGYDESNTSCYRVYNPEVGQTRRSVHVTFDEEVFPAKLEVTCRDEHDEEVQEQLQEQQRQAPAAAQGAQQAPVGAAE